MRLQTLLVVILVLVGASGADARNVVLCVGVDTYDLWSPLTSCVNDATGFHQHLGHHDPDRWPERHLLTDGTAVKPTKESVRSVVQGAAAELTDGDLFVYYQSSHGASHGSTDTSLCLRDDLYHDYEFAEDLELFGDGVDVVVVIDACYAAGMFKEAGGAEHTWPFADNTLSHFARVKAVRGVERKGPAVGFLVACNYDQECFAGDPYSMFTSYLLDGFQNGDGNGDGALSFLELFEYASPLAKEASDAYCAEHSLEPTDYHDGQVSNESLLAGTFVIGEGGTFDGETTSSSGGGGGCSVGSPRTSPVGMAPLLLVVLLSAVRRSRGSLSGARR